MEPIWNIDKIQAILPQRYPFLFIDSVLEINEKEKRVVCAKNVSINDYFFEGHFSGNPVMPGVIIIEAMAQASIILFAALKPNLAAKHPDYYLGKVETKFKKPVVPGDRLILEVSAEKILNNAGIVKAVARVDNETVAEARITFGVKAKE
ncbi:MAG: 3-hydroxyacyl-ACP dehydratase FabZ [Candidatus Omnitrophica bacterium]|nr:3-hydroxyacyl-ACP dehydratase FabZ [Candidatus Omnitrophota bacterium]